MSTGHVHPPQHTGRYLLADGVDPAGRHVEGNVVVVDVDEITDPADLPLGGPAEPGLWALGLWVEDPGGKLVRYLGPGDDHVDLPDPDFPLDPPEVIDDPAGAGDLDHLDRQYQEPGPAAAA